MPSVTKQSPNAKKAIQRTGGVLGRIVNVADATTGEGIKMAVFGRGGTGKTTLLSTFEKPLLSVVCSNSVAGETRSIKKVPGIETVTLEDEAELVDVIDYQRKSNKYKTIGLDHVTGYSDLIIKKLLNVSEAPAQLSWGTLTQQQYGELGAGLKERLRSLLSLSCNVVINSQERQFNDEGNASEMLMPNVSFALTPSVVGWLGPAVDYIVYTFIRMGKAPTGKKMKVGNKEVPVMKDKAEFCLRVGPHPVYSTKFRAPKGTELPDVMVDPSYDKILALIEGKPVS